ncbi:MAG: Nif3-like dinuclear metal center hexameric protein [Oscillospiraceae bacterium]|nr:Nif3-like dinuclear metal center hexameric protein [Oscillospiraceae bacterium]
MATVNDILAFVETLAPRYMKMEWDNVGLLCGRGGKEVTKLMVALDPFYGVCSEAAAWGADVLVTHHPLIFRPAASVTDRDPVGRSILCLIENGIAAINAHTNLDQAAGGVNDCLAAKLGLSGIEVVEPEGEDANGNPWGLLRAGSVKQQTAAEFAACVKQQLCCSGVRFVDGGKPVQRVAVGGGACADELRAVLRAGCDTLVTADAKCSSN